MSKEDYRLLPTTKQPLFSGNIFIFFAFDVGDDINFKKIEKLNTIQTKSSNLSKLFKNYHIPLEIELPHPHNSARCINSKLHKFGTISLIYKIPITNNLIELRNNLIKIEEKYLEQSIIDAYSIYKRIKSFITKPNFFHLRNNYSIIQINPEMALTGNEIKKNYSEEIAALLRLETDKLSEHQKEEILKNSIGYFSKDLIIIDTDIAFIYDPQYEELLDFFEFASIQQLELQYFDKLLDEKLTEIYNQKTNKLPFMSYLPFIGSRYFDPVGELNNLKVDISVITERLENSIKIAGEPYFSKIYDKIKAALGIKKWQDSIDKKFEIIKEMHALYQKKVDSTREDTLTILIIILILIELIVALNK